ncbi:MAG: DUF2335 domain-containing protein [Pseudomonadota bacterium]|nr:DUF2335 domain-containing protein [Pseudomonadota bacterium]
MDEHEPTTPAESTAEQEKSVEAATLEGEYAGKGGHKEERRALVHARFSGPLPPPEILQHYKEIEPDFPERILRLTEGEAAHRRELNMKALGVDRLETVLGQVFGFLVALAAFATAGVLGYLGHPAASTIVGGATIGGLVAAFIKGRSQNSRPSNAADDKTEPQ